MTRRRFLKKAAVGTGMLVAASLPYGLARLMTPREALAQPAWRRLRPPGALKDEAAFNAACIGCGLCG